MCQRLSELRQAMADYAGDFEPDLYTVADCDAIVDHAAALEKMAGTVKAAAAARVADTSRWREAGARSAAHHLASRAGTTVAQAAEAITTARRLRRLPRVAAAAAQGGLSLAQASAIAAAASADPGAEATLVSAAQGASLATLRDECAATRAAADGNSEERRRHIHRQRSLRSFTDAEGAFNLHMRDNPEVGARLMAALEPLRHEHLAKARASGSGGSAAACGADALVELVERGAAAANPSGRARGPWSDAKILVRVDLPTFLRGHPTEGETCEIAGYGPVAVSAVREMIESGDPFLAAVATRGTKVTGVAHLGRRATAIQRTALEWVNPRCANIACPESASLEIDHRQPWAATHLTMVDTSDRLCRHEHYLKTFHGWSLVEGTGRRAFVAPDDPRHPAQQSRPP